MTRVPLAVAPLKLAAKLLGGDERFFVQSVLHDPGFDVSTIVTTRVINDEPITVITMVESALPRAHLEIHLERANCMLSDFVGPEGDRETIVEGTAFDLLDQREQWPPYKKLFDGLDGIWNALASFLIMHAQGEKASFHLYGRARGMRDVVALPFRATFGAIDWRSGTIIGPQDLSDYTPRLWHVSVSYVGDRTVPSAVVRRESERHVAAWLSREMLRNPNVPATFDIMYRGSRARGMQPTRAIFTRAWKTALQRVRAEFPDTRWGRPGPRGPRIRPKPSP